MADGQVVKNSNALIYMTNHFLDAVYSMSLPERRVLWYVLRNYKLGNISKINVDQYINHREYADLYNISVKQASREVHRACDTMAGNGLYIPRPDRDSNALSILDNELLTLKEINELKAFQKIVFAESSDFAINKGESLILFTKSFLKFLIPNKNYFTQYRLFTAKRIVNPKHITFFDLMKRWVVKGRYECTPTYLINKLQLTYPDYSQMKRGFLMPALKKINKESDLYVTFEPIIDPTSTKKKIGLLSFKIVKKGTDLHDKKGD